MEIIFAAFTYALTSSQSSAYTVVTATSKAYKLAYMGRVKSRKP